MKIKVFGIRNCDSVKKAREWLDEHGLEYTFHDFRKSGIDPSHLRSWIEQSDIGTILNKRGLTWRQLPQELRETIVDKASAVEVMMNHTSLIKRPVIEVDNRLLSVGVNPDAWSSVVREQGNAA
jgi:arsenate reductase (glutaredoxin)